MSLSCRAILSPKMENQTETETERLSEKAVIPLGLNAEKVISKRYSLKDEIGEPLESWSDIVRRVVGFVSTAEKDPMMRDYFYNSMLDVMLNRQFVPNTPCLVNAGKPFGQLAACFVLNVPDSINGIMEHASAVATIHQTGGGTGMTYEFLASGRFDGQFDARRGFGSGFVYEYRQRHDRSRQTGRRSARREYGNYARHAPGRSAVSFTRKTTSIL